MDGMWINQLVNVICASTEMIPNEIMDGMIVRHKQEISSSTEACKCYRDEGSLRWQQE